ncbi:hypothetical protein CROQUDRAFT_303154 [Cronartium quercuum f. sp. fusiforme G11]|uniref:Uncharacterized protein n=1 Tax=Cronartium quercuum f. sp. fusiforme G11 TaxID=708437 RepID=A0A9P6NM40_9BASI|nr:hypothetical protein CROQUDRAFT_303154 [Cronartium quercuum f. sp. fusiforme G11]
MRHIDPRPTTKAHLDSPLPTNLPTIHNTILSIHFIMFICTCSSCVTKRCTDKDGKSQPGQFISRETQLKHHCADLEGSQDHLSSSRESSPK